MEHNLVLFVTAMAGFRNFQTMTALGEIVFSWHRFGGLRPCRRDHYQMSQMYGRFKELLEHRSLDIKLCVRQ